MIRRPPHDHRFDVSDADAVIGGFAMTPAAIERFG